MKGPRGLLDVGGRIHGPRYIVRTGCACMFATRQAAFGEGFFSSCGPSGASFASLGGGRGKGMLPTTDDPVGGCGAWVGAIPLILHGRIPSRCGSYGQQHRARTEMGIFGSYKVE
jgi:hypothetical protein